MLNSKTIGNKISIARKKINLSQAELSRQVSISPQAVGKWERGESLPDITTLNQLAQILGVDLNYFSENFQSVDTEMSIIEPLTKQSSELPNAGQKKKLNWDMSGLNLVDSDFSSLKNLHKNFDSSNIRRCLFLGSNMSGLQLNSNNIDGCDFSDSDISNSQIQGSNFSNTIFKNCSMKETGFSKCYIGDCDFSDVNFTKTTFKSGNIGKNITANAKWNNTNFNEMQIQDIVFEGTLDGCFFENCAFYGVKFQNATLLNTFFKNNKNCKRVQFIDCKADKLSYAFLKSNQANLTGITLLP